MADDVPQFFLSTLNRERVLVCTWCGERKRIEDRPGAMAEAEAAHMCPTGPAR